MLQKALIALAAFTALGMAILAVFANAERASGSPGACRLVVYKDPAFGGQSWRTHIDQSILNDRWDEEISSIQVIGGTWQFYEENDYKGAKLTLQPGSYPELGQDWTKQISSFRCVFSAQVNAG